MTAPVMQLPFSAMSARVVHACSALGLADLLDDGPRSGAQLARATGAHAPSLRRLLRALAGLGVVEQVGADRYALTDAGRPLRAADPGSIRRLMLTLCGPEAGRSWNELVPAVLTGECGWDRAHGMSWVDFYARDADAAAVFNGAMAEHTRDAAPGLLAAARFSRFRTVVDVGGGDGTLLAAILRAAPGAEGVVYDLPAGLADAAGTLGRAGVADRCRVTPGDFFDVVPEGADAYVLKQVLHDWDDGRAVAILRSCRAAMGPCARLLVLERLVPERITPTTCRRRWSTS